MCKGLWILADFDILVDKKEEERWILSMKFKLLQESQKG